MLTGPITWTDEDGPAEGAGMSGHNYRLEAQRDERSPTGTAWLVLRDGYHGYTFIDRASAVLMAERAEAFACGTAFGFDTLSHENLLSALLMASESLFDLELEDEDDAEAERETAYLQKTRLAIETEMARRNIALPGTSIH